MGAACREGLGRRAGYFLWSPREPSDLGFPFQAMESKLLVGGKNIVDHTNEQQKILEQKRQEIAEQVRGGGWLSRVNGRCRTVQTPSGGSMATEEEGLGPGLCREIREEVCQGVPPAFHLRG